MKEAPAGFMTDDVDLFDSDTFGVNSRNLYASKRMVW